MYVQYSTVLSRRRVEGVIGGKKIKREEREKKKKRVEEERERKGGGLREKVKNFEHIVDWFSVRLHCTLC